MLLSSPVASMYGRLVSGYQAALSLMQTVLLTNITSFSLHYTMGCNKDFHKLHNLWKKNHIVLFSNATLIYKIPFLSSKKKVCMNENIKVTWVKHYT